VAIAARAELRACFWLTPVPDGLTVPSARPLRVEEVVRDDPRVLALRNLETAMRLKSTDFPVDKVEAISTPGGFTASWVPADAQLKGILTLLALADAGPVGCVDLWLLTDRDSWLLENFLIHADYRRRGYGEALFRHARRTVELRGGKRVTLYALVEDVGAVDFWRRVIGEVPTLTGHADIGGQRYRALGWHLSV
jgi:ribosomal protein S18 acetylase RimI-like enzyme